MQGEPTDDLNALYEQLRIEARRNKQLERQCRDAARNLMELRSRLATALAAWGIKLVTEPKEA
jgi:hypothetical protein